MSISRKCRYSESVVFPKYLTPHGMPHSTPSGFVAVTNSQIRKEMRNDSCQTLHEVLLIGFFSCREENHYAGSILNTLVFMQRSTEIASPCSGHFKLLSFDRNFNGNVRSQERIQLQFQTRSGGRTNNNTTNSLWRSVSEDGNGEQWRR